MIRHRTNRAVAPSFKESLPLVSPPPDVWQSAAVLPRNGGGGGTTHPSIPLSARFSAGASSPDTWKSVRPHATKSPVGLLGSASYECRPQVAAAAVTHVVTAPSSPYNGVVSGAAHVHGSPYHQAAHDTYPPVHRRQSLLRLHPTPTLPVHTCRHPFQMSPPTPTPPAEGWPHIPPNGPGWDAPAVLSAAVVLAEALSRHSHIRRVPPSIIVARRREYPTFPHVPVSMLEGMIRYLPAALAPGVGDGGGGGGGTWGPPPHQGQIDAAAGRLFDHWVQVQVLLGVADGGLSLYAFHMAIWTVGLTLAPAEVAGHFQWADLDTNRVVSRTEFIAYVGGAWHQRASFGGWEGCHPTRGAGAQCPWRSAF